MKVPLFATLLTAMCLLLLFRFEFLQVAVEAIESPLPYRAVVLGPVGNLPQGAGFEPARPPLRFPAARDESRASSTRRCFETAGMLIANGSESSVTDRSPHELRQDCPSRRVCEGGKGEAQLIGGHVY